MVHGFFLLEFTVILFLTLMQTVPKDLETVPPHPQLELLVPSLHLHLPPPPAVIVLLPVHELLAGEKQLRTAFHGRQCYAETMEGSSVVVL